MNALKCRTLGIYNTHVLLKLKLALYTGTAESAIGLTGAVRMLLLPHAVAAGALLYIEQENLIAGKPEVG